MKTCQIEGCDRRHDSRGYCGMHAQRLRRNGDPLAAKFEGGKADPLSRFLKKIGSTDDCWIWTAATTKGYGVFWDGSAVVYAHRWSYEHHVGPIPDGLVLDHLCRIPACVNPTHLEPVTLAENTERGARWGSPTHNRTAPAA